MDDRTLLAERILDVLAEIADGRCSVTYEAVAAEPDPAVQEVLMGLVMLSETLALREEEQTKLIAHVERSRADEHAARLAAEHASEVKARFLANMSHEIRTPLHGVIGMLDLLATTALDARQEEYTRVARESGEHLLGLLDGALDLSQLDAGQLVLERVPCDLPSVIAGTLDAFAHRATAKGLALVVAYAPSVPRHFVADVGRLRQVLLNLVGNAIKFCDAGQVRVRVERAEGPPPDPWIRIAVEDSGPGIAEADHARIFERFAQSDTSSTRRHGGSGLGLAIVRELVTLMGGTVSLTSRVGEGAVFVVELPLAPDPGASDSPRPDSLARGPRVAASAVAPGGASDAAPMAPVTPAIAAPTAPRVLVVDDNAVNLRVVSCMLEHLGCRVDAAGSGAAALAAVAATSYALVLLDCHMPGMDGFETARAIRGAGRALPVIALTPDVLPGTREACLHAGMDDYLAKPVSTAELRESLQRWLRRPDAPGAGPATSGE